MAMADKNFPLRLTISAKDKASGPLGKFSAAVRKLNAPFKGLNKGLGAVGGAFGKVRSEAFILGAAMAGAGFAIFKTVQSTVEAADKLGEMSQRVGLGVDAYAQLQHAAAQADVDQESFNGAMDQFNKRLGAAKAGTGALLAGLNKISPALAKQVTGAKSTEEAFGLVTKAFEQVTDSQRRSHLSDVLFGKSGLQMGQFLGQGSKAIDAQRRKFLALHGSKEELVHRAGVFDNTMRETSAAVEGVKDSVVSALLPAFNRLAIFTTKFVTENREGIIRWAREANASFQQWANNGGIDKLVGQVKGLISEGSRLLDKIGGLKGAAIGLAAVMAGPLLISIAQLSTSLIMLTPVLAKTAFSLASLAFGPVVAAIGNFVFALRAGYGAMAAFNLVVAANPIGLLMIGLAGLAGAGLLIYKNWEPLKRLFGDILDDLRGISAERTALEGRVDEEIQVSQGPTISKRLTAHGARTLGADAARPRAMTSTNNAHVSIDVNGLPPGSRVKPGKGNAVPMDLNVGYSMAGSP